MEHCAVCGHADGGDAALCPECGSVWIETVEQPSTPPRRRRRTWSAVIGIVALAAAGTTGWIVGRRTGGTHAADRVADRMIPATRKLSDGHESLGVTFPDGRTVRVEAKPSLGLSGLGAAAMTQINWPAPSSPDRYALQRAEAVASVRVHRRSVPGRSTASRLSQHSRTSAGLLAWGSSTPGDHEHRQRRSDGDSPRRLDR